MSDFRTELTKFIIENMKDVKLTKNTPLNLDDDWHAAKFEWMKQIFSHIENDSVSQKIEDDMEQVQTFIDGYKED